MINHYSWSKPRLDPETTERHRSGARLVALGMLAAAAFLSLTYAALTVLVATR